MNKNIRRRNKNKITEIIDIETIIINTIIKYIRKNPSLQGSFNSFDSFDNSKKSEILKINVAIDNNNFSRFQINNVKFFDLFYDEKFNDIETEIKYIEKNTYFRDVIVFIDKIKNVIKMKNDKLLRHNL